ncbi:hypothetical protein [Helicobacter pylori]|uniref:hypothetical protein n=2 Tax=Helicobacter pylori TaxID=210 RepID=UPI0018D095A1|nr:hypothetical protein [Helicobacter pylori]MBH0292456.1 hypothetical protein [Helicobacter pylori]
MGNLASGHFKPTNKIQAEHNDRTLSPSYLIPQEFRGQNEVNRHSKQAMILKNQIIENAHEAYLITFKQKSQAKSYQWSLVVNIKTDTTMSDLEKLAEHFEIKYGFQCYQIAIHRDEGYMDENNQPHTNHHAHMEFITLNKENGKNMMRKAYLSPKNFREIQTEIAQILGMERGTDKRVSGTERIEPRKYAQMKNKERKEFETKEQELNTLKDTNQEQAAKNQALVKEIAKLEKTNKDLLDITKQYLLLDLIYDNPTDEKTEKKAEDYKHLRVFTKLWNAINLLLKILKKLFGDEKTKKDHQDILNTISELQERPTRQELETKDKEINTLKQDKTTLTNKLQEQATETKKAQERVKTLESNETALKNDLNAKESAIQAKEKELNTLKQERTDLKDKLQAQEKTINELNKQIQDLRDNQERERMKAENKRLQEQGLEKIYTQKDYEDFRKRHEKEIEALKKEIQEQEKTIKKNTTYRRIAENARSRKAQQKRKPPTPSPTPQPTYTYTKRM